MFPLSHSRALLFVLLSYDWASGGLSAVKEEKKEEFAGKVKETPLTAIQIAKHLFYHFSEEEPRGLPLLKLADPMAFPESYHLTNSLSLCDQNLFGLSNLTVEAASFNLSSLTVQIDARLPVLSSFGRYLWKATMFWSGDESGTTNISLHDVQLSFRSGVRPDHTGRLVMDADDTELEMTYDKIVVNFENLSTTYLLGVKAAIPIFLPSLVTLQVKEWLVEVINPELHLVADGWFFPDSTPPLDFMMTKVRLLLRDSGMEPWYVGNTSVYLGLGITLQMDQVVVSGLSTVHRTRDCVIKLVDNTFIAQAEVGAHEVKVTGVWWVPYLPGAYGRLDINIDTFSAIFELHQRAHMRSPPVLRTLDGKIGNMEFRSSGMGSFDYLLEAAINILPNVFRNEILNRFEPQLWKAVQEQLNTVDLRQALLQLVSVGNLEPHHLSHPLQGKMNQYDQLNK
ncbi:uncharacterized protein [Procambarus clarkii]|uniref:uncharacterized protein isoform X1 n=1 Tax=Procambarus clarkii TaxID=6728 RepID=UPI0037444323